MIIDFIKEDGAEVPLFLHIKHTEHQPKKFPAVEFFHGLHEVCFLVSMIPKILHNSAREKNKLKKMVFADGGGFCTVNQCTKCHS